MTDENTTHQPYQTINHYTCRLTIPDDETTEVIIKTKSVGVAFAKSPEDALLQTKIGNEYSHQSYASYIMNYVRENLWNIDVDDTDITFTDEPTIKLMTQEELKDLQVDVVSANG
jgi:aryl-alcohol dehydrogenase-like predicted oxidoreductase